MATLLLLIAACVAVATAQPYQVTVSSGSGTQNYRPNGFAHVWADPPAAGQIFDRWTGDVHLLRDPRESHVIARLLQKRVNLTATYRTVSTWSQTEFVLADGTRWGYYFPPNHVGVIFRFHGTNGNQGTLWNSAEDRDFANQAVAAGYALVSGKNVTGSHWDAITPPATNLDYVNVTTVVQTLQTLGLIRANDKIFALGFSNGGTFASYVAHHKNWKAAALYCSAGLDSWMFQTTVPHIWNLTVNDGTLEPEAASQTLVHRADLAARGIAADHRQFYPSPVYANRFWRIPGLTAADSQAIYTGLKNAGLLDQNDFQRQNPRVSNWQAAIPIQYASYSNQIENQLQVCYAEHNFFSDANYRVLQFLNARL